MVDSSSVLLTESAIELLLLANSLYFVILQCLVDSMLQNVNSCRKLSPVLWSGSRWPVIMSMLTVAIPFHVLSA